MNRKLTRQVIRYLFLALLLLAVSTASYARVGVIISVGFAPPALPVYQQPLCPGDGYIWTPGYWAWDGYEYYWVPGTWILAPQVGFLWTPPWWGWGGTAFIFHEGYWGPHVGWYGGISYGFGYFGHGYEGGRWDGGHFFYNRTVNNINVNVIHNVYNTRIENVTVNHISYNGGRGGIDARPTREEEGYANERHVGPVPAQVQHMDAARNNRDMRASVNQGKPPVAASARPGEFNEHGTVEPAHEAGGRYQPPAVHPTDLPKYDRPPAPNTGDAKLDQKYQKQQDQLYAKQEQERQKLQQQQEREHQNLAKQNASEQQRQQMEQRHQQQTYQQQQQHFQQQQQLQEHQASHGGGHH